MLIGERMSQPVISIPKDMPIHDAMVLFKTHSIRRAPVIQDGKLVGIVSDKDLFNASPSQVTSLSVWELNYLLSKITVQEVMTRDVFTVQVDTPIEEAARLMADKKIGGLPVLDSEKVVGMITETDLFKIFLELLGARTAGVRVAVVVKDQPGQLANVTKAITEAGGNFISFGQFSGTDASTVQITFKVAGLKMGDVRKALEKAGIEVGDIREC